MSPMPIEVLSLNCFTSTSKLTFFGKPFHGFYTERDSSDVHSTKPSYIQVLMYYCFGCTPAIQLTIT
jgi:hypothetical protein